MCIMRELYHKSVTIFTGVVIYDHYVLLSNYYFLNNFRVSISIASSSELVVADLDGGSTYGQEKDLASCVSDDP